MKHHRITAQDGKLAQAITALTGPLLRMPKPRTVEYSQIMANLDDIISIAEHAQVAAYALLCADNELAAVIKLRNAAIEVFNLVDPYTQI